MRVIGTAVSLCFVAALLSCGENEALLAQSDNATSEKAPSTQPANPQAGSQVGASSRPDSQPGVEPKSAASGNERTPAVLTIIEQGQEPRASLRYKAQPGQKQAINLSIHKTNNFQALGEQRRKGDPLPKMVFRMETEVKEVKPNGDIQYVFGITDGKALEERGVSELSLKGQNELAAMVVGVTGTATISSRGFTQEAGIVIPPTVNRVKTFVAALLQDIRNAMEQNWLLLPEQPVGVGAKWQVVSYSDANATFSRIKQVSAYEVDSIEGDKVRLKVTVVEESGRQPSRLVQGGMSQTLISHEADGSGTMTLDLASLMPVFSSVSLDTTTEYEYEINGHREPLMFSVTVRNQIDTLRE